MKTTRLNAKQKKWTKKKIIKLLEKYDELLPEQDAWSELDREAREIYKESKDNPDVREYLFEVVRYYEALDVFRKVLEELEEE